MSKASAQHRVRNLITIIGTTGVGKSQVSINVNGTRGCSIVNKYPV